MLITVWNRKGVKFRNTYYRVCMHITAVCTVTLPWNTRELKPSQTRGVRLNDDRDGEKKQMKTNKNVPLNNVSQLRCEVSAKVIRELWFLWEEFSVAMLKSTCEGVLFSNTGSKCTTMPEHHLMWRRLLRGQRWKGGYILLSVDVCACHSKNVVVNVVGDISDQVELLHYIKTRNTASAYFKPDYHFFG